MANERAVRATRARFADVSPARTRKKPRWLSPRESTMPPPPAASIPAETATSSPADAAPIDLGPSLRPAPVPKEFVQAVQREIRAIPPPPHERARERAASEVLAEQIARSIRPSEAVQALPEPKPEVDAALARAFENAVEEIGTARARIVEEAGSQLAALAAVIARRVIARELTLAPGIVEGLVREALDALSEQDSVQVRVGRGFEAAVDGLEERLALRGCKVRVTVADALGDYDCVVETELGQVDESVERRLEKLLEALKPDSEAP